MSDDPENPPTHTVYTPVWQPEIEGGKFRKWLEVGRTRKSGDQFGLN